MFRAKVDPIVLPLLFNLNEAWGEFNQESSIYWLKDECLAIVRNDEEERGLGIKGDHTTVAHHDETWWILQEHVGVGCCTVGNLETTVALMTRLWGCKMELIGPTCSLEQLERLGCPLLRKRRNWEEERSSRLAMVGLGHLREAVGIWVSGSQGI